MKTILGFALMIACTVVANLFLKIGATVPESQRFLFGFLSWKSFVGVAFFGGSLVTYAWLLRLVPLNVAQCFTALQFIGVILASAAVLSEGIPPLRWVGIGMISVGILIVGMTADFSE